MGVKVRFCKGAWWLFINHARQRKAKRLGEGPAGKKAADLAAIKLRARLAEGDMGIFASAPSPAPVTLADYAGRWLQESIAPHRKPRTAEYYRRMLDLHLLPGLGALPLPEITREKVRKLIADKTAEGLSRATVRNCVATLRAILNQALEDGLIGSNPATRFGRHLQHRHDPKAHVTALTHAEVGRLLEAAAKHYPAYEPLVALLFLTGLREGEAFGLQWGDVDFAGGFIEVRRTVDVRPGRFLVGTPKSGKLRRVDLAAHLAARLARLMSLRQADAALEGREPSPWLFPALTDPSKPLNASWFRGRVWYSLLGKAALRHVRIHDARHTYASLLLQAGEPIGYVKEQLGHSSIQVTVDLYGHWVPGANRQAVDRLAEAVEAAKPRPNATPAQPAEGAKTDGAAEVPASDGAPGVTRTRGTQFRKLLLYPPELRGPSARVGGWQT